jgi:hypothetical protein
MLCAAAAIHASLAAPAGSKKGQTAVHGSCNTTAAGCMVGTGTPPPCPMPPPCMHSLPSLTCCDLCSLICCLFSPHAVTNNCLLLMPGSWRQQQQQLLNQPTGSSRCCRGALMAVRSRNAPCSAMMCRSRAAAACVVHTTTDSCQQIQTYLPIQLLCFSAGPLTLH